MDDDFLRSFDAYLRERADRPLGDVERVSGRTLQPFSVASQQAAANLLNKAYRALDNGDLDLARGFVDRAVQLPFDEHEGAAPIAMAAHMELFNVIVDAVEEAGPDESRWLDAAVDVLAEADDAARCEIRDVLVTIGKEHELYRKESKRIRSAVASVRERAELPELSLTPAELSAHVLSILRASGEYRQVLEALGD